MDGLIPAYMFTGELGRLVGSIKGWHGAWSMPTVLPHLLSSPGSLLLYDRLHLDRRSYERFCDGIDDGRQRSFVRGYVESEELGMLRLIEVDSLFLQTDAHCVERHYKALTEDTGFVQIASSLEDVWGPYAQPDPVKFGAMNVPVTEVLRSRLGTELGRDPAVVDDQERSLLFKISAQHTLSEWLGPYAANMLIELAPKSFGTAPAQDSWSIDALRRLRESEHLSSYRTKVDEVSASAAAEYERVLSQVDGYALQQPDTAEQRQAVVDSLGASAGHPRGETRIGYTTLASHTSAYKYGPLRLAGTSTVGRRRGGRSPCLLPIRYIGSSNALAT